MAACPGCGAHRRGPILIYSPYEKTQLKALASQFPELRPAIEAVTDRLLDLLPIVRRGVYHPGFAFSNSIKSVAPALSPGFSYGDLDGIADGTEASTAFLQLTLGAISPPEQVCQLRAALLAYCRHDTWAMVEVHRALAGLAADLDAQLKTSTTISDALEAPGGTVLWEPGIAIQTSSYREP